MSFTKNSWIDLHAHSTASDGGLSPTEVIERAANRGVRVMALTDHDTISGLEEAQAAAKKIGVLLINGIEISTAIDNRPLHVVGLNVDPSSASLHSALSQLADLRLERAMAIGRRLEKLGFADAYAGASQEAHSPRPGRAHFARWLIGKSHFKDMSEVFERLLGRGKPAYVATKWPQLEEVVTCIRNAGGMAVLAHPLRYKLTASWLRRIAQQFKEMGGTGLEVSVARQSHQETDMAANVARRSGLHGSVASDFHSIGQYAADLGGFCSLPSDIDPVWTQLPGEIDGCKIAELK
ncbi:MAG: PHP domain-containing protein [Gammaproteobacteria bacterium]